MKPPLTKSAGAFHGVPLSRILGYGAGGLGLAALENQYVGSNLPPQLKAVNEGIGAGTGAMLASRNPEMQTAALTSIPLKEIGLFAVGGMDRFRRQQQALTDTNLQTARLNQTAARLNANSAGGHNLLNAAFLVPALAGGGAAGVMAYLQWKKNHKGQNRYQTTGTEGEHKPSQKIRIDIPQSALPKDFYESLRGIDHNPKAYARLQKLQKHKGTATVGDMNDQMVVQASAPAKLHGFEYFKKQATTQSSHPALDLMKNIAWSATGIPNGINAVKDLGGAVSNGMNGDYDQARRYGASGAANAALALLSLRFGAPTALKLFGRGRIGGVLRDAAAGKSRWYESPTGAKFINRWGGGHELGPATFSDQIAQPGKGTLTDGRIYMSGADRMARRQSMGLSTDSPLKRRLDINGRYDASRYSFTNPTAGGPVFRALATDNGAKSLPGHLINAGRYGLNRGINAAYAGKQLMKRHPFATGFVALPSVGAMGVMQDESDRKQDAAAPHPWYADYSKNEPSGNFMPMSSMSSSLLGAFGGGNPMSPLRAQIGQ